LVLLGIPFFEEAHLTVEEGAVGVLRFAFFGLS
jgi:hypothetical protein